MESPHDEKNEKKNRFHFGAPVGQSEGDQDIMIQLSAQ
jgi:hypothetical protein